MDKLRLLEAMRVKIESLEVPELGISVMARGLTLAEFADVTTYEASLPKAESDLARNLRVAAKTISIGICDDQGKSAFTEDEILSLPQHCVGAIRTMFNAIWRLSGLTPESTEATIKNSETVRTAENCST